MAKDNTPTVLGVSALIFFMGLLVAGLMIFSPVEDNEPFSISNVKEEIVDLSTLPRHTVDTSICYDIMSCVRELEKEGMTLDDVQKMGLELNCDQIPCYFQGINYHAQ